MQQQNARRDINLMIVENKRKVHEARTVSIIGVGKTVGVGKTDIFQIGVRKKRHSEFYCGSNRLFDVYERTHELKINMFIFWQLVRKMLFFRQKEWSLS